MVYPNTTGGIMADHCRHCNIELTQDNWHSSARKRKNRQCKECACVSGRIRAEKHRSKCNGRRMWVNGKYIPQSHPLYKPGRYKTFSDAAFDGTYKLDSIKEGYVYAITNPAWPEWVKIGMAIDADDRCNGYQTSSPFRDYVLEHIVLSSDRREAEAQAHRAAGKIAQEQRGEWFKLSIEQAKNILNNITVDLEKTG